MKQNFVTFYSPGTSFHEETTKPIDSWDIPVAIKMSKKIVEPYGAKPFSFVFSTRSRRRTELDSKEAKRSQTYFLGGEIFTLQEVQKKMPNEKILISNMRCNKIEKVVVNNNSWRSINPFKNEDVLLLV